MTISVCIASVRGATLNAAITSLRRQTWQDWELIVIGQGEDATVYEVATTAGQKDPRIHYIHLRQRGLAAARNAGIAAATGDIIAMTDDDCEAREDWLATLAACFAADPEIELVGGSLICPEPARKGLAECPGLEAMEILYDPVAQGRRPQEGWDWIGGNFAIRSRVVESIGEFDPCLGAGAAFCAGEDTDYKLRMEAAGMKMLSTPRSVVQHTYGHRYGIRSILGHVRNYATSEGALAAKLTLLNDSRGPEWLRSARWQSLKWCLRHRPQRLPLKLLRLRYATQAYRRCLRDYEIDATRRILRRKQSADLTLPETVPISTSKS